MSQKDFMPPNGEGRNGRVDPSAGRLIDEAKHAASHLASEAKDEVSSRASTQKERAAKSLESVADALRGTRHELDENAPAFGEYADKAADTVQQLSDYIRSRNVGDIIDTVEKFARRESALFLGGAFAIGLLSGRFLRSSRPGDGDGHARFGGAAESSFTYGSPRADDGRYGGRFERDPSERGVDRGGMGSPGIATKAQSQAREVTKLGGFSSSSTTSSFQGAVAGTGTAVSTGQSSNLEEGSAGTGPASSSITGSSVTPKKGSGVE